MKFTRIVYSPKAYAFIYSRKEGRVIDVSNDIVAGTVNRLVNQPSTAAIKIRNDNYKYTGKFNPKFFPMDGITIWLQKNANQPIQVFTGFIDTVPYFQAYPGQIEITATCTLKQYLYTHFDPGVGFFDWIATKGWIPNSDGASDPTGFFNDNAVVDQLVDTGAAGNDGGVGQLLHDFIVEVGGFDASSLAIGDLPAQLPEVMKNAYLARIGDTEKAEKNLVPFFERLMTMTATHTADDLVDAVTSALPGNIAQSATLGDIKALAKAVEKSGNAVKPTIDQIVLAAVVMSGVNKDHKDEDTDSPLRGEGFFAEAGGQALPSTPGGGASRKKDMSPEAQAKRFCDNFAKIVRARSNPGTPGAPGTGAPVVASGEPLGQDRVLEVAQVLAFAYGKESFYSQIIEACRSETNASVVRQIVECLNANRSLDEVVSTDIINMAEVAEMTKNSAITWEALFPPVDQETEEPQEMPASGSNGSSKIDVAVGSAYSHPKGKPWSPIPYAGKSDPIVNSSFPKVDGTALKHSEIQYFIYARAEYNKSSRSVDAVFNDSELKVGQIVTVTGRKTKKTCRCVYMGATNLAQKDAPIAVSEKTLSLIGRGPVSFSFTDEKIPEVPKAEKREDYIASVLELLGPAAKVRGSFGNVDITDKDAEIYEKHYKNSNARLAEYFFIAVSCGLHLLDHKPDTNNLLLSSPDATGGTSAAMRFLTEIGVVEGASRPDSLQPATIPQSFPKNMTASFDGGSSATSLDFDIKKRTVSKTQVSPGAGSHFKKTNVVVQVISGPTFPSPVWNGEAVRLPNDLLDDAAGDGTGTGGANITWADLAKMNTASAFTTLTSFPFDIVGSALLQGEKSLMNDVPLMEGVVQLCRGSMRSFMSLPNGMFCAFYPDYFGAFGRMPYLNIKDPEIIDLNIVLNDAPLVTHMYVNGNTIDPLKNSVDQFDQLYSVGVITLDDVFGGANRALNFINDASSVTGTDSNNTPENVDIVGQAAEPPGFSQFYQKLSPEGLRFIETYGTRPKVINEPLIRSPWFEFLMAYNEFTYNWSMHTATTVDLAFMPEVMAGGLVRFPDHNINMYVEAVTHQWDYSSGFETTAMLSAPSTYVGIDEFGNEVRPEDSVPGLAIFNKVGA
jgi:hypothetical protein